MTPLHSRVTLVALVFFSSATPSIPALDIQETDAIITVANSHYRATINRNEGGALSSLRTTVGQQTLLSAHRLYTDFGFYRERGHVGTTNETAPQTTVKREAGRVVVTSSGSLRGKPADDQGALRYQLAYTFSDSPGIHVRCDITPAVAATNLRAFLASCFVVPEMSEWAVNTADGIMRGDFEAGPNRNYDSTRIPINAEHPQVGFITQSGTSLLISNVRTKGNSPLQGVIVHGRAFFLAWLCGVPTDIDTTPLSMEFDVSITLGDPM